LFQTNDPDEVIDHVPDACGGCGSDLTNASPSGVVRRQVHDIPVITPIVVEHRLLRRRCGCGATTTATAPAGVSAAAVYGPNLRALAVYLLVFQHVPVARTQALIADLTGARPSTGWISSVLSTVADLLVDAVDACAMCGFLQHLLSDIRNSRQVIRTEAFRVHRPSRGGSRCPPEVVTCGDRCSPAARRDHGRVASPTVPLRAAASASLSAG
jgi:transposase